MQERAFRNAEALYLYMFERWRNDLIIYHFLSEPFIDSKFGIIQERV